MKYVVRREASVRDFNVLIKMTDHSLSRDAKKKSRENQRKKALTGTRKKELNVKETDFGFTFFATRWRSRYFIQAISGELHHKWCWFIIDIKSLRAKKLFSLNLRWSLEMLEESSILKRVKFHFYLFKRRKCLRFSITTFSSTLHSAGSFFCFTQSSKATIFSRKNFYKWVDCLINKIPRRNRLDGVLGTKPIKLFFISSCLYVYERSKSLWYKRKLVH